MSEAALRHFVEEALATRSTSFDRWFPAVFDWRALCDDVPQMVAQASGGWVDDDDAEVHETLRARASAHFRFAHVASLAVLAARTSDAEDPGALLDDLTREPDDDEEERLAALVGTDLGAVEAHVAGSDDVGALSPAGVALADLFTLVWPDVEDFLDMSGLRDPAEALSVEGVARPVLLGVARIGALLACARWLASGRLGPAA